MSDELRKYKWGIFYYDRKDRRIFVPKRNRLMGWTLNFANPFSYLIIIGISIFAIMISNIKKI